MTTSVVEGLPVKGSPAPLGLVPPLARAVPPLVVPEVVGPVPPELAAPVFVADIGKNQVERVGYK